ncbi:hypothetical protein H0I25_05615 [Cellulophaga sp. HaHa_2_95]|uniref:tetratricopeptide repeat protein n=1 Tax=unclassified Cellulophaga TaxID=2634405 RepID=UPI001C4F460F|nr:MULTISPECIES: hypothetical protein [unclassified Cellulophaga]QXP54159.1 hypothetical protein H0I24_09620 [Cellulophaga sp. HaHa_2_1]QXP57267.1 hypothetical protein H0I25_05615 [Cellulophaga sp. HaHa_2_95]
MKQLFLFLFITPFAMAQATFVPVEKERLDTWLTEAKENGEVDTKQLEKLDAEYADVLTTPASTNRIFDYGRILTIALQPGLASASEKELSGAGQKIVDEAEKAYRNAISNCDCHGRANIMLGLLYNQQGKYYISEPYLEKGLELEEGGEDWMIAANQYLLAGAYTYNTAEEKYVKVYELFKKYAKTVSKDAAYYQKMAGLYVSYYE